MTDRLARLQEAFDNGGPIREADYRVLLAIAKAAQTFLYRPKFHCTCNTDGLRAALALLDQDTAP